MKHTAMKIKGAKEMFGIEVTVDKKLDKTSSKSLFPEKLNKANKIISNLQLK